MSDVASLTFRLHFASDSSGAKNPPLLGLTLHAHHVHLPCTISQPVITFLIDAPIDSLKALSQ